MRVSQSVIGILLACATALGLSLPGVGAPGAQPAVTSVSDEFNCENNGCQAQNDIMTCVEGNANSCGVVVTAVINEIPDSNLDGRCVCDDQVCKAVAGRSCRAHATVTVIVTAGTGYKFCHTGWTVTGNTATKVLDSGTIACDATQADGSSGVDTATMSIQCGTTCGPATIGQSAWLITARSQCYACKHFGGC